MCAIHRLHSPQRALYTRPVEHVDVVLTDFGDRRVGPKGLRVVDQGVQPSEARHGGGDHGGDLLLVADVDLDAEDGDTERGQLVDRRLHPVGLPLGDNDARPGLSEVVGHASPHALTGAGDDDDALLEVVCGPRGLGGGGIDHSVPHSS